MAPKIYDFPKDSRPLSTWLQEMQGHHLMNHRTTPELPIKADIVIIGSGLTGTTVAKHCIETWPEKKIVVLEAREFCSGATGRNAGHCKPDQWRGFKEYEHDFGTEQALKVSMDRKLISCHHHEHGQPDDLMIKILGNEQQTWSSVVDYVRSSKVDCELWVGDTLDVPITREAADEARDTYNGYKAAGGKVDHIKVINDPVEATKVSRIKDAEACYAWSASTVHPWKLSAHVMSENLQRGVNLQTRTMVTQVVKSNKQLGSWIVETSRGDIECAQVVHATNAYSPALEPSLRGLIKPTPHMCNLVVPPVSFIGCKSLKNSYGILLSEGGLITINPRKPTHGPVLFGGSNPGQAAFYRWLEKNPERATDDDIAGFPSVTEAVQDFTRTQLIDWPEVVAKDYAREWSGIIAMVSIIWPMM
ncbi:unnamed protein product [Clonostachys rosea]|uniref:FAD dependent oxidoreductase domain-containing protein n=1 Tax=Bionectria ochroleuca TaxID=29856 RepID=A0ABY6U694_BIOOC|nr:unnamed protein product [Clonostachys rosea]